MGLKHLREVAEALGGQVARVLPDYTDHSVRHMDALWGLADQVLTPPELEIFSVGEAFVLGCTFYVHDLGMASAATAEGIAGLKQTDPYRSAFSRAQRVTGLTEPEAKRIAIQISSRQLHAEKCELFVLERIPGVDLYLLEPTELREKWGMSIGSVSASHHWSLPDVDKKLGMRGRVPDDLGGEIDLGFLACMLRIIDFANISSDRARYLDRVLRSGVATDSLMHWRAQEHIAGPRRQEDQLVYGSVRPIKDVDAWWLFYEMAAGLDTEIQSSAEYLAERASSSGRFSLEGVKGIRSPITFSACVQTDGFEPVDIRFHPDSMERLIGILGGRTLYGDDHFAPIRELLQNATDAILLRIASEAHDGGESGGVITVESTLSPEEGSITVKDNGVGMTAKVVTDYLLGVAANYWSSPDFYADFPSVTEQGFAPTGRFGIGFLSVFMMGDRVEVQTQRAGQPRLKLQLHGVGRRGALIRGSSRPESGTTIRVAVALNRFGEFDGLSGIVRARAPMLSFPIRVVEKEAVTNIPPQWWKKVAQEELYDFVQQWPRRARRPLKEWSNPRREDAVRSFYHHYYGSLPYYEQIPQFARWPGAQPEVVNDSFRVIAVPGEGIVLLCSTGIAVGTIRAPGMVGLVEAGDLKLDAARSATLGWDKNAFVAGLISQLCPKVVTALDGLAEEGRVPDRFEFLCQIGQTFGSDVLTQTSLPWITVVEPPGHARLVSADELRRRASARAEVLIGYGLGPWSVRRACCESFPEASGDALVITVDDKGGPRYGSYEDSDELMWAALADHFSERKEGLKEAVLLTAAVTAIGKAWGVDPQDLANQSWCRHKSSSIRGHLKRPSQV